MNCKAMDAGKPGNESAATAAPPQVIQEFVVKIPKDKNKRFNVMRFNHSLKMDVTQWKQVKMERENNLKEFKLDDDNPKYGAGSEYGREQKDEARRKKHGIITKQYNPDDQPWLLKVCGKTNKKFKGIREGGVTENASFYVFTQAADGTFEAYPVSEWYNFTPIQCFKALSAEEAEEEFGRRDKVLNYFSIMVKKRCQADTNEEEDDDEKKQKGKKKKKQEKDFKITDFDEWGNQADSDASANEDELEDDDDDKSSKKKGKNKGGKKKKKEDAEKSDEEPLEESDEGDFDDKEVDYITSSSGSEEEDIGEDEKANRELKGVEDEDALRKLMEDEDEDEEVPNEDKEQEQPNPEVKEKAAEQKTKKKSKSDSSGESSSESSDSDFDDQKFNSAIFVQQNMQKSKKRSGSENGSAGSSRANTPTKFQADREGQKGLKRKLPDTPPANVKKVKVENQGHHSSGSGGSLDTINEEMVRRYLQRKPMTASELLHKFKSKKTKMSSEQLVTKVAEVLKKMDLQKTNIKGKMYLSLKTK